MANEPDQKFPTRTAGAGAADSRGFLGTTEAILERLAHTLEAETSDIARFQLAPCRYCWGAGHRYQWTSRREYHWALTTALHEGGVAPRPDGGFGYRRDGRPNPDCPECCGAGEPVITYTDPRDLPAGASDLIAALRKYGDRFDLQFRSKSTLLENYARLARLRAASGKEEPADGAEVAVLVVPEKEAARVDITNLPGKEEEDNG